MSRLEPVEKAYWLAKVCEANYERLRRLIPDLGGMAPSAVAHAEGKPALHVELLEHSPYTLTLELSHCFGKDFKPSLEPAVKVRVYLDARTAEVLSDHARPKLHEKLKRALKARDVMDYKWTLNYFLSRWLDHCLAADYHFGLVRNDGEPCEKAAC